MLNELPLEVLQQIAGCLPTASSITNLSQASRQFHAIVTDNDQTIFGDFVRNRFPSIRTPPPWRDAARVLTSRSRAWDRKAFVAKECHPPSDPVEWQTIPGMDHTAWTTGYHPVIDSYETWQGGSWSSGKEVLAWGAAGRLRVRTIVDGVTTWTSSKLSEDDRQDLDIMDVRLLRPSQHDNKAGETILLRTADGATKKLETSSKVNDFHQTGNYNFGCSRPTGMDVNSSHDPLLALCDNDSVRLYPVHSSEQNISPLETFALHGNPEVVERTRCLKFLSETSLAIASQYLQGLSRAPLRVYDVNTAHGCRTPLTETLTSNDSDIVGRHNANVVVPLDDVASLSGQPGRLILSGWTDGISRLHDMRTPSKAVAKYVDVVDDGQIMSLLPIGHERFVAGGHQNGCLKTFDLRLTGARPYSHKLLQPTQSQQKSLETVQFYDPATCDWTKGQTYRGINIFVNPWVNRSMGLGVWDPLPTKPSRRSVRYRGALYSLSSPSPSSPTIYVGMSNHVLQLDFFSTDDEHGGLSKLHKSVGQNKLQKQRTMEFSCYERPRSGHSSTDPVLLRKQTPLHGPRNDESDVQGLQEEGWDERWRLETQRRPRGTARTWI
ncbi:hypothetical protein B0A52_00048 [Exophiala mesophila]|uniref:F-box domain-containing protein n=1 Tax=Exophiala mesophila TaxID=212818 RepID=A0A438NJ06_EXOME|nr:hypothetical protein B0A52_00048 [Exophiala mesophila]